MREPSVNFYETLKKYVEDHPEEVAAYFGGIKYSPKGWVKFEDHLPQMRAEDLQQGYSTYNVKTNKGFEFKAAITDPNTWIHDRPFVTHWWNK